MDEVRGRGVPMTQDISACGSGVRRWRATPIIHVSILLHAAALIALAVQPALWPWAVGALVGNHLVVSAAVLWPRGRLLGPNLVRLPESAAGRSEVCLTFDDGPDPEITPRVLDLLDRYRAKASFFCIGRKAQAHPEIVKEIARRGHSVESHSYGHPHTFSLYGMTRLAREVEAAQTVIAGLTGRAPVFFRAPVGFRGPMLAPVLAARGLRYVSWTRRGFDAVHDDPAPVLRRLMRGLAAGDVLMMHDTRPVVLAVLPELLDQLAMRGLKPVSLPVACGDGSAA
ncbi:MAG: polysaccharide deacetylase family protein [Burkholderiales bacterium]